MRRYALRRTLLGIITVVIVSMIIFIATRLSGDVAILIAPPDASDAEIQEIRVQLGLNKPIPYQYYVFVRNALKGDFGRSIRYNRPAIDVLLDRFFGTVELVGTAFIVSIVTGVLLGTLSATRRGTWLDQSGKLFALLGQSMPGFWVGIMLILVFSVNLGLLPTSGRDGISHLLLPSFSMAWYSIASIMRVTRSSMMDVMDSEYIKMARSKGNPEYIVIWKHGLKNALIPVIALAGVQLANLLGGAVIIENVFNWPGLGSMIVDAIYARDYPLVQAGVFFISIFLIALNLIVDLLFGFIDPRITYE
ncbi:MAG: ABC transporter permease [Deltaproteobacteria bacterium]|nr:ABC transporter permease [Deltaproteobacteria bacterium]